jgi:thiosulfate/3-mercaptopyruvate sulfurtransferase
MKIRSVAVLLFALSFDSMLAKAQSGAVHSDMLVSTDWLAAHVNDPKVVILHVGDERGEYEKAHIPGAQFLSERDFATAQPPLKVELPPAEKLKHLFESAGIGDDTRVVIYSPEWYPVAARAYFTLDYIGHTNTALLDGSIEKWLAENRPVTREVRQPAPGSLTLHVNEKVRALLADAKTASAPDSQTVLLDSRPEKRYTAGHLPGADLIFWEETVLDPNKPTFRSAEELQELFGSRGVAPGRKVITYCEIGLQASHNYFVAKYLGYDVAMYDGSFQQWSMVEQLPVVKGESPR